MNFGFGRHSRFLWSFLLGAAIATAAWAAGTAWQMAVLLGVNSFFLGYLVLTIRMARRVLPADLKRHAASDDEGIVFIVILATSAVVVSLMSIIWVLRGQEIGLWQGIMALSAVPLGWGSIHTLASFHYAHLYYSTKSGGGLNFPNTKEPGVWDFLYLSFGIGMTAQVADVSVSTTRIRKMVLGHSIASFFYNAVILALAVNAGLELGS